MCRTGTAAVLVLFFTCCVSECPKPKPMLPFDGAKFLGDWYAIEWLSPNLDERGRCVHEFFGQTGPASLYINMTVSPPYGHAFFFSSPLFIDDPKTPSRVVAVRRGREYRLTVIDTDYEKHGLFTACSELSNGKNVEYAAVLSRKNYLPEGLVHKLKGTLEGYGVDVTDMYRVDQTHCQQPKIVVSHHHHHYTPVHAAHPVHSVHQKPIPAVHPEQQVHLEHPVLQHPEHHYAHHLSPSNPYYMFF